jgi:hypothetical protein
VIFIQFFPSPAGIRDVKLCAKQFVLQRQVDFFDRDSVCRGGLVESLGMISAMVVVGDYGGETILKAGKRITLQKMTLGRIHIGKHSKEINRPISNMIAYLKDQALVIEGDQ